MTTATPCSRASAMKSGCLKLSWRTSTTWRIARPSTDFAAFLKLLPKSVDGLGEDAAVGGEARSLDREDEIVGRLVMPLHEARRLLRPVIGAVDLDRGQFRARILK